MIWIILTFVFGWLLCGAWALRMSEKDGTIVERDGGFFYAVGLPGLIIVWFTTWPERLWKFGKGVVAAWKQALKGKKQ